MVDYSGFVIAAVVLTALVAGLIANKYLRPFAACGSSHDGGRDVAVG